MDDIDLGGGSGNKLGRAVIYVAGAATVAATGLALYSIWLQLKNYRKPLLQRFVVRILLMVPLYAITCWLSLWSFKLSFYIEPIRDIYEAFVIYCFFALLIAYLGGERNLVIMMHGRTPKPHAWPLNHFLPRVDISDPYTFLAVKRGILQYTWLKPILAAATVLMKWADVYQEGYIGLGSGYLWSGLVYNVSVTVSLYSLAMFWVCMAKDLQPFRPMPKFLTIKLVIFASYWQGFALAIFVWLGTIHQVGGYTPDNIARAIQDALICFEMPMFAIGHWYAFSYKDYCDPTISAARMPVYYALRDAFGVRDLVQDSRDTLFGERYGYRAFEPGEVEILPGADARWARQMEGLRYEKGGKSKYWIPKPPVVNSRTALLGAVGGVTGAGQPMYVQVSKAEAERWRKGRKGRQVLVESELEFEVDERVERLYRDAKGLEFGDYNYPVIEVDNGPISQFVNSRGNLEHPTTSTHAALLKGKGRADKQEQLPRPPSHRQSSTQSGSSTSSAREGLVDLVVEDRDEEERERVRARKEGRAWDEDRKFYRRVEEGHRSRSRSTGTQDREDSRLVSTEEELESAREVEEEEIVVESTGIAPLGPAGDMRGDGMPQGGYDPFTIVSSDEEEEDNGESSKKHGGENGHHGLIHCQYSSSLAPERSIWARDEI